MADAGPLEQVRGPDQPVVPLVDAVVGVGRAGVPAHRRDPAGDLGRRREDRVARQVGVVRGERHLLVADGDVGALDDGPQRGEHRVEVVALPLVAGRGLRVGALPDGVVPEQVAAHHHGDRARAGRRCRRRVGGVGLGVGLGGRAGGRVGLGPGVAARGRLRPGVRRGEQAQREGAGRGEPEGPEPGGTAHALLLSSPHARTSPTTRWLSPVGVRLRGSQGAPVHRTEPRGSRERPHHPGRDLRGRAARRPGGRRGGGRCRRGARCGDPWPDRGPGRAARPRQRYVVPLEQARARRAALSGDVRLRAGARGAGGARPAAHPARSAPGPAGAVPLPAPPHLGTALRRRGPRPLRRAGRARPLRHGRAPAPAPVPPPDRAGGSRPATRRAHRRDPLLRLRGRRRPAGDDAGPHRRPLRRAGRDPHPGHGVRARGRRHGGRGDRDRPRVGCGPRDPGSGRGDRDGRLDRRDPAGAGRPARARRRGQQGHPPRRPARPDPERVRPGDPHREVGAVRGAVGPALDHRHHRHRLGPRPGPPGGVAGRHRLPARARQQAALRPAGPRRRRRRLRRPATAAGRQAGSRGRLRGGARGRRTVGPDHQGVARAHRGQPGAGRRDGRRRQAHDVPRDGARRDRPRRP